MPAPSPPHEHERPATPRRSGSLSTGSSRLLRNVIREHDLSLARRARWAIVTWHCGMTKGRRADHQFHLKHVVITAAAVDAARWCSIDWVRMIACFIFLTSVCTVALDSSCIVQFDSLYTKILQRQCVGRRLYDPTRLSAHLPCPCKTYRAALSSCRPQRHSYS